MKSFLDPKTTAKIHVFFFHLFVVLFFSYDSSTQLDYRLHISIGSGQQVSEQAS